MSFRKFLWAVPVAMLLVASPLAHAAPAAPSPAPAAKSVARTNAQQGGAPHAPGAAAQAPQGEQGDQQQKGPQPGKPLPFLGNTFFIFGGNALKLGSVDMQAKKELGSIVWNPPWNPNGVSMCGGNYATDATDKTKPVCVNVNADSRLDAPAIGTDHLTLKEYNYADLPKDVASTDVFLCKDCYVLRPTFASGFFGAKKTADEKITNVAVRMIDKQWKTLNGELVHYGQ